MKKVVIIGDNDFRDEEIIYPFYRLQEAGFSVDMASDGKKTIYWKFGVPMQATISFDDLATDKFDAVIIPGGNESPDRLRTDQRILGFIGAMNKQNKLIAAICHGLWVAISAKVVYGKRA